MKTFATIAAVGALAFGLGACQNCDEANEAYANDANAAAYADNGAAGN